jgi:hypothetical protein
MQVNRTCILRLGSQCAPSLRWLLHSEPGWCSDLRLAPAAARSSSRRKSYPRFSSKVMPSSSADSCILRLAPQSVFFGPASDRTSGFHRMRYLPATPSNPDSGLRLNPYPPVRLKMSFQLSPVTASSDFAGGRLPAFARSPIFQFLRLTNFRLAPNAVSSGSAGRLTSTLTEYRLLGTSGGLTSDLRRRLCLPVRPVSIYPAFTGFLATGQAYDELPISTGPCIVG